MEFRFIGCGDAFGSGGRFNTCFLVRGEASTFLIDCGATSLVAMRQQDVDPGCVDAVFVSHLHGDHFGGLPFLILDAQFVGRRTRPLVIAGPPGIERRLEDATEVLYPGFWRAERGFELRIVELEAEMEREIAEARVTPYPVRHFSGAPSYALRIVADGRVLSYSGDTEWVDVLVEASRDADLFVCECNGFEAPVRSHLNLTTLREKRSLLTAKRLILTHLGPQMLAHRDEVEIEQAFDGKVVEL